MLAAQLCKQFLPTARPSSRTARCSPGRDGTLVGQVAGDAALVALLGAADEGGVEDEAVLGRVALGLQRPATRHSSDSLDHVCKAETEDRTLKHNVVVSIEALA